MTSKAFENEFLKGLNRLSKEQQAKVISYVKTLLKKTENNNGRLLFAGNFNTKDVQEISAATEPGCENIHKKE